MRPGSNLWWLSIERKTIQWEITQKGKRIVFNPYRTTKTGYKHPPKLSYDEFIRNIETIADMWSGIDGWWISGAVSIALATQYGRTPTNLDIGVVNNPKTIDSLLERAEKENYWAFRRPISRKKLLLEKKDETVLPLYPENFAQGYGLNTNAQLKKVIDMQIKSGPGMLDQINIFPHKPVEKTLPFKHWTSIEDGLTFDAEEMELFEFSLPSGKKIRYINQFYMIKKKRDIIEIEKNKKQKHREDFEKLHPWEIRHIH